METAFGAVVAWLQLVIPALTQLGEGFVFLVQLLEPLALELHLVDVFGSVALGLGVFADHSVVC